MRLLIIATFLCFSLLFVSFHFAFASDAGCVIDGVSPSEVITGCYGGGVDPGGATGVTGVKDFVTNIAQGVIAFAALFAVGAIVFAGIRYTTSYGEDEKHKSAKDTAIAALIGLALCLIAFPLVELIVNFFYSLGEK